MNKKNETVTLSAEMVVMKTESGMDYVQVLPANPQPGVVQPFSGSGRGQLLSNGTFDFTRRKRRRHKPELKLPHTSLSYGDDGMDRCTFILPSEQRAEFRLLLLEEILKVSDFLQKRGW